MALTELWQNKNKREKGLTNDLDIRDKESTFDINIGSGNLLQNSGLDKKSRLLSIRNSITEEDKQMIIDLISVSSAEIVLFDKMREQGLNLEYLVALGLADEEDVQAYNILTLERGIDVENYIDNLSEDIEIDSTYLTEVENNELPLPKLKKVDGTIIKEFDGGRGLRLSQSLTNKEREELEELRQELLEKENYIEELKSNNVITKETLKEGLENMTDTVDTGSGDEELDKLLSKLTEATNNAKYGTEDFTNGENYEGLESKETLRNIYVLDSDESPINIDGYNVEYINNIDEINMYMNSPYNLLVLTRGMTKNKELIKDVVKWLNQLGEERKYRVVCLYGSKLRHPKIETEINLTKEDLDNYFRDNPDKDYIDDGVGVFKTLDIDEEDEWE